MTTAQQKRKQTMERRKAERIAQFEAEKRRRETLERVLLNVLEAPDATPADKVRASALLMMLDGTIPAEYRDSLILEDFKGVKP